MRFLVKGYSPAKFYVFEVEADDYWEATDKGAQMLQDEEGLPDCEHVTTCEIESVTEVMNGSGGTD